MGEEMSIRDSIGMMSTGALVMLGFMYVFGDRNPAPQPATAAPAEVTRAQSTTTEVAPVTQIEAIVALSQQGIENTEALTDEQLRVIAFFEDTARQLNENQQGRDRSGIYFSNMAVSDLNVQYFYRVPGKFDDVDRVDVLTRQAAMVKDTLCQGEAIQTLMNEYGFAYTYTYTSADFRKVGEVTADASTCL